MYSFLVFSFPHTLFTTARYALGGNPRWYRYTQVKYTHKQNKHTYLSCLTTHDSLFLFLSLSVSKQTQSRFDSVRSVRSVLIKWPKHSHFPRSHLISRSLFCLLWIVCVSLHYKYKYILMDEIGSAVIQTGYFIHIFLSFVYSNCIRYAQFVQTTKNSIVIE